MSKKIFIAIAALACGVLIYLLLQKFNRVDENTIVLGTMSGWPPYVSINDNGEYEGFDIDIANEIAKDLNKKLIIKDMDTIMLINALNKGSVDFVMTGLSITNDRLKKITMVPYEGESITELPLIFWDKIPEGVSSLEDLQKIPGAIVCVEAGSFQEDFIKQFSGFELKQTNPIESLLELKYGKALACLLEPTLFADFKSKYPNLVALIIPLDENNKTFGNGIGVKKDNIKLTSEIESLIKQLKCTGFLDESKKRWLSEGK